MANISAIKYIQRVIYENIEKASGVRKMKRVTWDLEEAVVLLDFYIKSGCTLYINRDKLEELSLVLNKRAKIKGIVVDEKFRNIAGLSMQIGCIHYIATDGKEGFSNASKIFFKAYELFESDPSKFNCIAEDFYKKYS